MKKSRFFLRMTAFALLFCLLLYGADRLLVDRSAAARTESFYAEPKDSLDVLFVGSSRIMCGIYPLLLWEQYGMTSFDCAGSAQVIAQSYFQLKDALNFQSPRLVVVDVSTVANGNVYTGVESFVHTQLDHMRSPLVRLEAIFTLLPREKRLEYCLPLVKYHSRWSEIRREDFDRAPDTSRGAVVYLGHSEKEDVPPPELIPRAEMGSLADIPRTYLEKIVALCAEKGAEVLFVNLPCVRDRDFQLAYNAVEPLAERLGVPYVNFLYEEELGLDYEREMFDTAHLNSLGAEKLTAWLGAYICENYEIPDRRNAEDAPRWAQDLADFAGRIR
ncbi:MAG: hypothetical protein IKL89_00495 [Clostridia bacterium]|nr:hypothetical protein [Clostridia bacterium]